MSQQQVAVESGKVVEHTELVPRVSAEYIAAPVEKHIGYIFADIRDKQGNNPDEKEYLFGFIACPLYPCREERHIKIQSDEQIDIPHMVLLMAEVERYHGYIFQRIDEALRLMSLSIAEEVADDFFGQTQQPREPGEHTVKYRPDEEREKYAEDALLIKVPKGCCLTGSSSNPVIITNKGTEGRRSEP